MSGSLAEVMKNVLEILSPLEADERKRVVQAAFALLGEPVPVEGGSGGRVQTGGGGEGDLPSEIHPAAAVWLQKARITKESLENSLHFDAGKVKVIALPGGATKRINQVINTYLMCGFASYLETGDPSFDDQDARSLCEHFGCYDHTNHAKYVKEFGNRITGSKASGWKLTVPGITAAGDLIKA